MDANSAGHYARVLERHHLHAKQYSQFGSQNCAYCGRIWKPQNVSDAPAWIYGCPDRLDALLAFYEAGVILQQLVPPYVSTMRPQA